MFAYEKLEIYKKAKALNSRIYKFLKTDKKIPPYLKNQFGRASLSIVLNIAEGSAKFSTKDRRNYFVTARGSAFECAAIVEVLVEEEEMDSTFGNEMKEKFDEVSRMIYAMISALEKKAE